MHKRDIKERAKRLYRERYPNSFGAMSLIRDGFGRAMRDAAHQLEQEARWRELGADGVSKIVEALYRRLHEYKLPWTGNDPRDKYGVIDNPMTRETRSQIIRAEKFYEEEFGANNIQERKEKDRRAA